VATSSRKRLGGYLRSRKRRGSICTDEVNTSGMSWEPKKKKGIKRRLLEEERKRRRFLCSCRTVEKAGARAAFSYKAEGKDGAPAPVRGEGHRAHAVSKGGGGGPSTHKKRGKRREISMVFLMERHFTANGGKRGRWKETVFSSFRGRRG